MKQAITFTVLAWLALNASAGPLGDFEDAFGLTSTNGFENPLVLVGFNPQPEPPGTVLALPNPTAPMFSAAYDDSPGGLVTLRTVLAIALPETENATTTFEPSVESFEDGGLSFNIFDAAGTAIHEISLVFQIGSDLLDPGSVVGFNPQPEPPGLDFASLVLFGMDATFEVPGAVGGPALLMAGSSRSTGPLATLTLQVRDLRLGAGGTLLQFTRVAVPAPPLGILVGLGCLALIAQRRVHARR